MLRAWGGTELADPQGLADGIETILAELRTLR
jgi:hypothetical protein